MRKYNIAEELDSDFYFMMAHLTSLSEEELCVSNIDLDEFGI